MFATSFYCQIPDFCDDALDYLKEDPQNVIAVHCKAGKGRTGVMVAALLMSMDSALRKAEDALRMFADIRTCDGKGVTIPSQVRYVRYWDSMLSQSLRLRPDSRVLKMERMTVFGNVKPEPYFLVLDGETREELFDSRRKGFTKLVCKEQSFLAVFWECLQRQRSLFETFFLQEFRRDTWVWEVLQAGKEVPLRGDLKFVFKAKERVLFRTEGHLFHFWINSGMDTSVHVPHITPLIRQLSHLIVCSLKSLNSTRPAKTQNTTPSAATLLWRWHLLVETSLPSSNARAGFGDAHKKETYTFISPPPQIPPSCSHAKNPLQQISKRSTQKI